MKYKKANAVCRNMILAAIFIAGIKSSTLAGVREKEPTPEEIRLQNQYVEYRMAQGEIYRIYVKKDDGVTTVQFPSQISEIAGKNVSADGKGTDFVIAARPGSCYFNISATTPGATGTLTVTYNRQLYIIYLIHSDKEAYASVVFSKNAGTKNFTSNIVSQTPKVTPARLVSLIDIAKKYDILKDTYPDTLTGTEQAKFKNRYRCGKYDIHLDEAIRFEDEDTIVFKLRLANLTGEEIKYDKHSFSAHTGDSIYYMSVSDASGIIPPKTLTYAWFGITSTSRGGRNNLKAENDWLIALTTQEMHLDNIQSVKSDLKEKERLVAEEKAERIRREKEVEKKIQAAEKLMIELDTRQKELMQAKAEMVKSFTELKAKQEEDKSEVERLLKETQAKAEAAKQKEAEADKKLQDAAATVKAVEQKNAEADMKLKNAQAQTDKLVSNTNKRLKSEIVAANMIRIELEKQIGKRKAELERKTVASDAKKVVPETEKLKPLNEAQTDAVSSMKKMQEQTRNAVEDMKNAAQKVIFKMNTISLPPAAGKEK